METEKPISNQFRNSPSTSYEQIKEEQKIHFENLHLLASENNVTQEAENVLGPNTVYFLFHLFEIILS